MSSIERPFRGRPVTVVDVGARWGVSSQWASLAPDLRVYGFDADPTECERLNQMAADTGDTTTRYIPVALGPRPGPANLYETVEPACSSLYEPRKRLVMDVPELAVMATARIVEIMLGTLDEWCAEAGVTQVDVIKLDTQGSELGVLRGAEQTLQGVQLLEVEVEFNPLYVGQPLFGDVDAHLRARGFQLWRLVDLTHYSSGAISPDTAVQVTHYFDSDPRPTTGRGGQLYWCNAYYARAEFCPGTPERPSREQAQRAAAIAHCLGLPDLAATALSRVG